jgi:hypothetical protein
VIKELSEKGSTLLLAMVIISTVLFAGIGVGTILSRQAQEFGRIEDEATAMYVARSVVDGIDEEFEDMEDFEEWNEMSTARSIEYKAAQEGEKYRITIKVGNDYYSFIKGQKDDLGGKTEDILTAYYDNRDGWEDVTMRYQIGGTWFVEDMEGSQYSGWKELEIEEEGSQLRGYFCQGTKENWIDTNCIGSGSEMFKLYPLPNADYWDISYAKGVCVKGGKDKPCVNPDSFFVYYDNRDGWEDVTMRYQIGGTWFVEDMEGSQYSGWKELEIEEEGDQIRGYFCQGTKENWIDTNCTGSGSEMFKLYPEPSGNYWYIDNQRVVCVESGVDRKCSSPFDNYIY